MEEEVHNGKLTYKNTDMMQLYRTKYVPLVPGLDL